MDVALGIVEWLLLGLITARACFLMMKGEDFPYFILVLIWPLVIAIGILMGIASGLQWLITFQGKR